MLTVTIPKVMSFANHMKLLDMMPVGYDLEYVTQLFTALGVEGRNSYLINQIPVDMIYPGLFGITYCLAISYLLKKINTYNTSLFYLCFIPLIAGFADYLENLGIISLLLVFPQIPNQLVSITNIFSITKSVTTTISFMGLILLLVLLGINCFKQEKKT